MTVNTSTLANGLTVITEHMPHLESAALGCWVKSGARDENNDEHGIAHLLEHMAFKGTKLRSARQIAEEIENVGGDLNAATSVETTSYYARVLKNDVPLALNILADILTESTFDKEELRREQHVILQEIGAADDTPDDVVFDHFSATAFRDQKIGRPILGTPESVQSFTSEQIRAYMDRNYTADRLIVVAAGAVEHDEVLKLVENRFAHLPNSKDIPRSEIEPAIYTGGDFRETRDLMDAHILLGFEGRAYHARDFYSSQILANILGGGMSSRLFQGIREHHGLCYSIYAFHSGFSDTGLFGIYAATGQEDIPKLMPLILEELKNITNNIDQQEVDRARAQISAGLLMAKESPAARASQIARQAMLFGSPFSNEELMERLGKITTDRLTDLAGRLFFDTKATMSAVGPLDNLPELNTLVSKLNA